MPGTVQDWQSCAWAPVDSMGCRVPTHAVYVDIGSLDKKDNT